MATKIDTIEEFEKLRRDPANEGRAYKVPKVVFDHVISHLKIKTVSPDEVRKLSDYLGHDIEHHERLGLTRTSTCPHCHHAFDYADHFMSAVESNTHTKEDLKEFMVGHKEDRHYVVIDTKSPIKVRCVKCHTDFMAPRCCYTSSSYAYT